MKAFYSTPFIFISSLFIFTGCATLDTSNQDEGVTHIGVNEYVMAHSEGSYEDNYTAKIVLHCPKDIEHEYEVFFIDKSIPVNPEINERFSIGKMSKNEEHIFRFDYVQYIKTYDEEPKNFEEFEKQLIENNEKYAKSIIALEIFNDEKLVVAKEYKIGDLFSDCFLNNPGPEIDRFRFILELEIECKDAHRTLPL